MKPILSLAMRATDDLQALLQAARDAGPGDRIDLRDPIAACGTDAIDPLEQWLRDPRLGGFAVRTLERIARDPADRQKVIRALASARSDGVSELIARDIADALSRITGRTSHPAGATPREHVIVEPWPGTRRVTALELRFHQAMLDIFRLAGEATRRLRPDGSTARGYWANYFLRGVRNHGGPAYARRLLQEEGTTEGFERLKDEGRLDLTMEALVLRAEYVELFSEDERRIAAHRLAEAGYQPPRE